MDTNEKIPDHKESPCYKTMDDLNILKKELGNEGVDNSIGKECSYEDIKSVFEKELSSRIVAIDSFLAELVLGFEEFYTKLEEEKDKLVGRNKENGRLKRKLNIIETAQNLLKSVSGKYEEKKKEIKGIKNIKEARSMLEEIDYIKTQLIDINSILEENKEVVFSIIEELISKQLKKEKERAAKLKPQVPIDLTKTPKPEIQLNPTDYYYIPEQIENPETDISPLTPINYYYIPEQIENPETDISPLTPINYYHIPEQIENPETDISPLNSDVPKKQKPIEATGHEEVTQKSKKTKEAKISEDKETSWLRGIHDSYLNALVWLKNHLGIGIEPKYKYTLESFKDELNKWDKEDIVTFQRLLMTGPDGIVGPETYSKYKEYVAGSYILKSKTLEDLFNEMKEKGEKEKIEIPLISELRLIGRNEKLSKEYIQKFWDVSSNIGAEDLSQFLSLLSSHQISQINSKPNKERFQELLNGKLRNVYIKNKEIFSIIDNYISIETNPVIKEKIARLKINLSSHFKIDINTFFTKLFYFESIGKVGKGARVYAVSKTGALGLGQATTSSYKNGGNDHNPFIPEESIPGAMKHFFENYDKTDKGGKYDIVRALDVYNKGVKGAGTKIKEMLSDSKKFGPDGNIIAFPGFVLETVID